MLTKVFFASPMKKSAVIKVIVKLAVRMGVEEISRAYNHSNGAPGVANIHSKVHIYVIL